MEEPPLAPVGVAFVSSHATGGGSERYLELLLESLDPAWVSGVVCLQDGPFVDRLRSFGHLVEVVPTPTRGGMVPASRRLRKVFQRLRPRVIHANGVKAALVCALATPGTATPTVWLKHDFSWDGPLARVVAWRSQRVVAVSAAITETFGPRLMRKVEVVLNGVPRYERDREAGRPLVLDLVDARPDQPVILLVGRLHPVKGQRELVETAPMVLERRPDARFLLMGEEDSDHPNYGPALRSRVEALGLNDAVRFSGHRSDPLVVMSGADVVVVPSMPGKRGGGREASGFALLEAMSVGTPVVAYAGGGIPEVLGDCGGLVTEGDRRALAAELVETLEHADRRRAATECALRRVRERHSLADQVAAMKRVYREVANSA